MSWKCILHEQKTHLSVSFSAMFSIASKANIMFANKDELDFRTYASDLF